MQGALLSLKFKTTQKEPDLSPHSLPIKKQESNPFTSERIVTMPRLPGSSSFGTTDKSRPNPRKTHRSRCGQCAPCQRSDCGSCSECVNKKKFGGDGSSRQPCIHRRCEELYGTDPSPPRITVRATITVPPSHNQGSYKEARKMTEARLSDQSSKRFKRDFSSSPLLEYSLGGGDTQERTMVGYQGISPFGKFMGRDLKAPPPLGSCAICQREDDDDETVLLCDGEGCGREYHLSCAGVQRVPEGNWYCVDCHLTGRGYERLDRFLDEVEDLKDIRAPTNAVSELDTGKRDTLDGRFIDKGSNQSWIGKPIWLRIPPKDQEKELWEVGRILDSRVSDHSPEFLIRFAAGLADRKQTLHRWIIAEDHEMLVGDRSIWLDVGETVMPVTTFLRTARFLAYERTKQGSNFDTSALCVGRLGEFDYSSKFLSIKATPELIVGDLDDPRFIAQYGSKWRGEFANAMSEIEEQKAVREWNKLERGKDVFHPMVLTNRDYFAQPPLLPGNQKNDHHQGNKGLAHAETSPCVMSGIDRHHVLQLLEKQGVQVDKQTGADLKCTIVPYKWIPESSA